MDLFNNDYQIQKKIRLIELFAGIGAQAAALRNLGVDYESYRVCEFDRHAVDSYNAVFRTEFRRSDVRELHAEDLGLVERDSYCYILTYSFPCTDLSVAGKQMGMGKGSGTRSGLLWEVERILDECGSNLPDVLLMENVTQVHGEKFTEDFNSWVKFLIGKGYSSFYADLNAKDFGVPQNRDRTFMVSLLGDYDFEFPSGIPLRKKLVDVMDRDVDERYYLSDKHIERITKSTFYQEKFRIQEKDVCGTLLARDWKSPKCVAVPNGDIPMMFNPYNERVLKDVSPTLTTACGSTTSSSSILISEGVWHHE